LEEVEINDKTAETVKENPSVIPNTSPENSSEEDISNPIH